MTRRARRLGTVAVVVARLGRRLRSGRSHDGASPDTTATANETGVEQFGDLASPCAPGDPSGTPDQAVDATSVTIGYGDDAGFQGTPAPTTR